MFERRRSSPADCVIHHELRNLQETSCILRHSSRKHETKISVFNDVIGPKETMSPVLEHQHVIALEEQNSSEDEDVSEFASRLGPARKLLCCLFPCLFMRKQGNSLGGPRRKSRFLDCLLAFRLDVQKASPGTYATPTPATFGPGRARTPETVHCYSGRFGRIRAFTLPSSKACCRPRGAAGGRNNSVHDREFSELTSAERRPAPSTGVEVARRGTSSGEDEDEEDPGRAAARQWCFLGPNYCFSVAMVVLIVFMSQSLLCYSCRNMSNSFP